MNYLIYGEDKRHPFLSDLFTEYGFIRRAPADLLILSPKESFSPYRNELKPDCLIWGGPDRDKDCLVAAGFQKIPQGDSFRRKNSVYTAEGALSIAITETDTALCDSLVSVLGYGFLGKECAGLFSRAGANIMVFSENPTELLTAAKDGYSAYKLTELSNLGSNLLLNTIPYPVLDKLDVTMFPNPCLLIELASIPCITKEADNIRIISAGALPSRFSPKSAAKLIFDEIIKQLKKE